MFSNSINLRFNGRILNISNDGRILPPYGIILANSDFIILKGKLDKKDIHYTISNIQISIDDLKLDLGGARIKYYSKICKSNQVNREVSRHTIKSLMDRVKDTGKKNGFGIDNQSILNIQMKTGNCIIKNLGEVWGSEFIEKLDLLAKFFIHGEDSEILKYFIGRGKGLTPSGDDFLVGMLSVFSSRGIFRDSALVVKNFLTQNEGKYTNDISQQFLILATEEKFSMNIIFLVDSLNRGVLNEETINNVLNFGETSGVDIILGMIFAYKIIDRSSTNE
ncbi:MAG: DUF2877 domain-containing protein [Anaerovoracaceae bacterium]